MRLLTVLCLLLFTALLSAQFDEVSIETTHVSGAVYMLEGYGGNLAVMTGEDGVLLVDDQYAPLTDRILAAIAVIDPGPVRFLINTHWHFDHTGGNEQLGGMGSVIVASTVSGLAPM